jgi:RHS repeat-associated protein
MTPMKSGCHALRLAAAGFEPVGWGQDFGIFRQQAGQPCQDVGEVFLGIDCKRSIQEAQFKKPGFMTRFKGTAVLQKMQYEWDAIGKFKKRTDLRQNISETFLYEDGLNRLTSSQVSGKPALAYAYDPNGNLNTKANVGTYSYTAAARPHAVTSIAATSGVTRTFDYDANGAFTIEKRNGQNYREVVWAAHQNVKEFKLTGGPRVLKVNGTELYAPGNTTTTFDYDASFSRSQKITERDQLQREVTLYLGSYERIVSEDRANTNLAYTVRKTEHRHSIGGLALKTFTQQGGVTSEDTVYYLKDHLGSLTATVDAAGVVKERYSFDAWGSRRDAATWSDSTYDALTKVTTTNRGYTGHEMLDELGIVHMNGRLYDPEIARVLSGDPAIQEPDNSQNYNRYSYVANNPLSFTDPSGYFFKKLFNSAKKLVKKAANAVKSAFKKVTKWVKENWQTVVVIAVVAVLALTPGGQAFVAPIAGSLQAATAGVIGIKAATGAVIGAIAGGLSSGLAGGGLSDILRGALIGGIQGGITAGVLHAWEPQVAGFNLETARHVAGHGVLGGSANYAMGGKFQDGFLSAAVSAAAGNAGLLGKAGGGLQGAVRRTITAGVIGGTASALGGGKFANGAYTAAFQHLLNAELEAYAEDKKAFLIGPDQTELTVDPRYGTGKRSNIYENMLAAARGAGFDVFEGATAYTMKDVWGSREYDTIVYYNHGEGAQLRYDWQGKFEFKPLGVLFDVRNGYAKNLTIACCQAHKVAIPNIYQYYKSNVSLVALPIAQLANGDVNRTTAMLTLTKYFGR